MVAADGEAIAVAAEEEDVQVGPGQADAGGERDGAAVNEMRAVAVDEIREARGTTDPGEGDDLLVIELPFLDDFVIGGEDGEVAAAGTPRRVVGGDGFLGDFFADELSGRVGGCGGCSGVSVLIFKFVRRFLSRLPAGRLLSRTSRSRLRCRRERWGGLRAEYSGRQTSGLRKRVREFLSPGR